MFITLTIMLAAALIPQVSDDPEDDRDWRDAGIASHSRLAAISQQSPTFPSLDQPHQIERRIIRGRMRGLKLKELAKELGLSTATVWRREQSAIKRIRAHGKT